MKDFCRLNMNGSKEIFLYISPKKAESGASLEGHSGTDTMLAAILKYLYCVN